MDYKNGKIYVIRNHCNDFVYIGSTTQSLSKRFSKHKEIVNYNINRKCHYKIYEAFNELGIENFYIELLELYPCSYKNELCRKEGEYIRKFDSYNNGYNMQIAGRNSKDYRIDNKKEIKERNKVYREKNKERIKLIKSKKFNCECGGKYTQCHKARHLKTKKHLKYIETTI